ncbi:MAG: 50S ribosomal protein L10 [bacterium]|nr:50S ribosomal protein L10 [bacterium]
MALTKDKKKEILASLTDALSKTQSSVFIGFKGLTVAEANELRAGLKKERVKYTVVKKTLLAKALSEKGYAGAMPDLPGEVAMAHLLEGDDVTAPGRSLQIFVKKFSAKGGSASGGKDKLRFLGGVLEGRFLSQSEMAAIAQIPAMPILRGMFVNIINSPIQRFVIGLNQITEKKV